MSGTSKSGSGKPLARIQTAGCRLEHHIPRSFYICSPKFTLSWAGNLSSWQRNYYNALRYQSFTGLTLAALLASNL
jgi:hypothetical protein